MQNKFIMRKTGNLIEESAKDSNRDFTEDASYLKKPIHT